VTTPSVDVVTSKNAKAGSVTLDPAVFAAPVKPHLFHAEVRRQLAKRRTGSHATKNRAGVSGGGIKPWKQKGSGRARQGSIRAPQWAGGGVVFGPVPRSHEHALPKKVRRGALRGAVSLRVREGALHVVDALALPEAKTKKLVELLGGLGLGEASVLIVLAEKDPAVERAARNLRKVGVIRAEGLNVYDVLRHERLLLTRAALDAVTTRLADASPAEEASA
jgi:large subunit ribosomal protein L4